MKRVIAQGDTRPMGALRGAVASKEAMDDLKSILAGRAAFYSKAEFRLDTSAQPLEETHRKLVGIVQQALGLAA